MSENILRTQQHNRAEKKLHIKLIQLMKKSKRTNNKKTAKKLN